MQEACGQSTAQKMPSWPGEGLLNQFFFQLSFFHYKSSPVHSVATALQWHLQNVNVVNDAVTSLFTPTFRSVLWLDPKRHITLVLWQKGCSWGYSLMSPNQQIVLVPLHRDVCVVYNNSVIGLMSHWRKQAGGCILKISPVWALGAGSQWGSAAIFPEVQFRSHNVIVTWERFPYYWLCVWAVHSPPVETSTNRQ